MIDRLGGIGLRRGLRRFLGAHGARWLMVCLMTAITPGMEGVAQVPWMLETVPDVPDSGRIRQSQRTSAEGLAVRPAWKPDPASWRPGDRWRIPLPEGGFDILRVVDVTSDGLGSVWVRGALEGDAGSGVNLVFFGEKMAGLFRRGDGTRWVASPDAGGDHRVAAWTGDGQALCGNHEGANPSGGSGTSGVTASEPRGLGLLGRAATISGTTHLVDLLVGYTPAAAAGSGGESGVRVLIELAVAEANDAFERSQIRLRLRMIGLMRVDYVESGELTTDLTRLTRSSDGWMDDVPRARDAHAADIVCLVTEFENSNQYAGMANQLRTLESASLELGYTVCLRPYLLGNYTLAHEIGHLLGGNHDRETSPEGGLLSAAFGARFTADGRQYRTVMAYRPGIQIPHFSNPNVLFRGVPTGTRGTADNAETLNVSAPVVAGAREPGSRIGFEGPGIEVGESGGTVFLRLMRTGNRNAASVRLRTLDGSAKAGTDYTAIDRVISLPENGTLVEVPLTVHDTEGSEGDRRFTVGLSEPTGGLAVGPASSLTVNIRDDDAGREVLLDTSFKARPGADYAVRAVATVGQGDLFVGGGFVTYDRMDRPRLARVRRNGGVDPEFVTKVKYEVNAILPISDGRVAVGGEFNTVNDERLNHVALLLPGGGLDPGFKFETGTDLTVHALALAPDNKLILGGEFTSVQGVAALRVARISLDGAIDTTFDTRTAADGVVHAVAVDGTGRTWLGGRFGRVEGRVRGGVARLLSSGRLDPAYANGSGADGAVRALVIDGQGRAVVAGEFMRYDGRVTGRLVRLTEAGSVDTSFRVNAGEGADDAVLALLARPDGTLWVAGRFVTWDGHRRNRVARLSEDGAVDPGFDPGLGANDWVMAMAERSDGGLILGGVFTEIMGVPRGGVAVVLPEKLSPARIGWSGRVPEGMGWSGLVWPRQTYAVERTDDLRTWVGEGDVTAEDGRVAGTLPVVESGAGFVRLRRVIE